MADQTPTPNNDKRGIVYVLSNPSMPEQIKIGRTDGKSAEDVAKRIDGLDNTSVPRPFVCEYAAVVDDARKVEGKLHTAFGDKRIRKNREFFEGLEIHRVQAVLELIAIEDVTPRYEHPDVDAEGEHVKPPRRSPFRFDMARIEPGTILRFVKDETVTCTVLNDRQVSYEGGNPTALSPLTQKLLSYSTTPAGPDYWMYEGETLTERRRRLELEGDGVEDE